MMKLEPLARRGTWSRVRTFVEAHSPFLFVFIPLAVVYLATANLTTHNHIDPLTNSLTGWHLGMTGSVVLPDHAGAATKEQRGNVAWIVESPRGPVGQYPPGAAALSAPFYRLWNEPMTDWYVEGLNRPYVDRIPFPLPSPAPAALAAALAAAATLGFVAAAIPYAGGTKLGAVAAGYVGGLGTTMWAVASDALWQHAPASMWIALGILLAARSQLLWSGLAFGAAILTRPHLAIVAAAVGLYVSLARRDVRPAMKVAATSLLGLGGLLWFNWWVWGQLTLIGGYGDSQVERFASTDPVAYFVNIAQALGDPTRGVLVYSPFLILLIPGLRAGWRRLPDWARGAAVGGLIYLLIQLKANRFSGGDGFIGYRYPLEALTASASLLYCAYVGWVQERPMMKRLFWVAVAASLVPQIYWKVRVVPARG